MLCAWCWKFKILSVPHLPSRAQAQWSLVVSAFSFLFCSMLPPSVQGVDKESAVVASELHAAHRWACFRLSRLHTYIHTHISLYIRLCIHMLYTYIYIYVTIESHDLIYQFCLILRCCAAMWCMVLCQQAEAPREKKSEPAQESYSAQERIIPRGNIIDIFNIQFNTNRVY